jgi:hypothetical protein
MLNCIVAGSERVEVGQLVNVVILQPGQPFTDAFVMVGEVLRLEPGQVVVSISGVRSSSYIWAQYPPMAGMLIDEEVEENVKTDSGKPLEWVLQSSMFRKRTDCGKGWMIEVNIQPGAQQLEFA